MTSERCLVLTGPTASGKTRLAVALARRFGGEIVSADSRQVFRGLDIGTGKDLDEYSAGGTPVKYHLIDVVEPRQDFNLFVYLHFAKAALEDIWGRGMLPIVCGGTFLYLDSLTEVSSLSDSSKDEGLREELERYAAENGAQALHKRLEQIDPVSASA
ncbi:MAG: tRNA (adenosine(37)-N6)-dimethylallyltransferase MiaA, partial [Victivallales bacterium]|nr:tRNA (adenosine(37)-N6)-dimethylallyltransferase MiaA [Victivallales bacterium]